jgi:hypothetical protein
MRDVPGTLAAGDNTVTFTQTHSERVQELNSRACVERYQSRRGCPHPT